MVNLLLISPLSIVLLLISHLIACGRNCKNILTSKVIILIISIEMKAAILLITTLLLTQVSTKCSDELSCFQKKLFNFASPGQSIYQLNSITDNSMDKELNVIAYGDINNDLHTDLVVVSLNNPNILSIYSWVPDLAKFALNQSLDASTCPVQSVFLYDMDLNGLLDIVIWGTTENNLNCLLPYIHQASSTFVKGQTLTMQLTTNPFVISFGINNGLRNIGLLAFQNGARVFLKYEPTSLNFYAIPWSTLFISSFNYTSTPFASPHSNSFLDLTGDCHADVVIVDNNNNIQFWISQGNGTFLFQNSVTFINLISLNFADMNYDGVVDLIIVYAQNTTVYFNQMVLKNEVDFCVQSYKTVHFNFSSGYTVISIPQSQSLFFGSVQIKDINIDGYPDYLLTLKGQNTYTVRILLSNEAKQYVENDQYKLPNQTFTNVISASFVDFWENGILDIIVCTQSGMLSFYNNYLQQNLFFIKGFGASGSNNSNGAQIVGASFYWVNSVGDGYRTTYQVQIPQTAYNALQTPYAYCGLGRANNYVESFSLGIYGSFNSWSPIIPNSQLAVYAQGAQPEEWAIRIYVLPTQSLIYVIIVSTVVLTILGIVLFVLKCQKYRKKEEPLMEFIH